MDTNNVKSLKMMGYAYINAANFVMRLAREEEEGRKAREAHNKKLLKQASEATRIADMEAELKRLQSLLDAKQR